MNTLRNTHDSPPEKPDDSRFVDRYSEIALQERDAAEERFSNYIAFAITVHRRLLSDPSAYAHFKRLTRRRGRGTK